MADGKRGEQQPSSLARLPPGRHGLSREFVEGNQQARLVSGTIAVVAEHGYQQASVAQIIAAAGVSRRTFYKYFASKNECFAAAYEALERHLLEEMAAAGRQSAEWPQRVAAELAAVLAVFVANPDLASVALAVPREAGGCQLELFHRLLRRLGAVVDEGRPAEIVAPSEAVRESLGAGVAFLIDRQVRSGGELAALLPDLIELVLSPYIGAEQAAETARKNLSSLL